MPPPTLTVSIVTYHPDLSQLDATLRKLSISMAMAREAGLLRAVNLVLIDNTGQRAIAEAVVKLGAAHFESSAVAMNYLHGHANIGYGVAHNLVMHGGNTHFHLVLNPDVELAEEALSTALHFFEENDDVGVIVPAMFRRDGTREYLVQALSQRARSGAARFRAEAPATAVPQAARTLRDARRRSPIRSYRQCP